ncbi:MAG: M23 family metallopeptidase [Maricaulaceae bacterium]
MTSRNHNNIPGRVKSAVQMVNTDFKVSKKFYLLTGVVVLAASSALTFTRNLPPNTAEANAAVVVPSAPEFDLSRDDLFLIDGSLEAARHETLTIKPGQNLGPLLQDTGIAPGTAYQITKAFSEVFPPRNIRAGQSFTIAFEDDVVTDMTFRPDPERTIFVSRGQDDSFAAREIAAELKYETKIVAGAIKDSLYLDASRLGAPDKVIQQFANIYEYSVDFQRDIRAGDEFELMFEVSRDHKGNVVKARDLLFTSFSPRGNAQQYYLFSDSKGRENFYDLKGKTAKRKLRATPINGARLSSSFGRRRHPISGYRKMHKGVDFAARRGTPILAAGTGVVERANRFSTYGNYVRIRHTDGYKTAYAHMKGFARGIRAGARVRQDQVIGYVGSTGASTGPHLHYEVLKNNKHINPRQLNQLSGKPLKASEKPAFDVKRKNIDSLRKILLDDLERVRLMSMIEPGQGVLLPDTAQ